MHIILRTLTLLLLMLSVAHAGTMAEQARIENASVRLAPQGALATAAFMSLHNSGTSELRLVAASSTAANHTQLHNHFTEGGMMKMRIVKEIVIPGGGEIALQPGGLHLMLIELLQTLREGERIPITLGFTDGSQTQVRAVVKKSVVSEP